MNQPSIRVLYVDDDPEFRELTATYLEQQNDSFIVDTASNTTDGRASMRKQLPDCIVADYEMPEENGIELLQTIRDEFAEIPFILFTGKGSEEVASEAISAGVTDYLQKGTGTEQYELLANRIETAVGQYRAEQKLERKNDLFKKTQHLADVGAWEWNVTTEEGYYSEKVYDIYGITERSEIRPERDIEEFYHPTDQNKLRDAVETAIATGERFDMELRVVTDDDDITWVRASGDPQFENGECVRIRGTIQDITDRKKREEKFKAERTFIQQSLNTLNDIFYLVDTDGNFQRWNDMLPELTGYTDEEIGSMNALEFFDGAHRETITSAIRNSIQNGSTVVEAEITTKDGRQIPHEFRGVRMADDDGNVTGVIGIARDITARKKREAELIAERDRLDEFANIITHDLRNPLTVAEGRLELARAECDSDQLDIAADAIDRSQALVTDVLTLARTGETAGSLESVQLSTLAKECWKVIPETNATLSVEATQTVSADRSSLRQLLENLFSNAVEHGGENVTVQLGDLTNGFYIADDGVGLSEKARENLFEAGYSTTDTGTGFGLRIVKQVVDAHGWEIQVTDSDNGGMRVEITNVDTTEKNAD